MVSSEVKQGLFRLCYSKSEFILAAGNGLIPCSKSEQPIMYLRKVFRARRASAGSVYFVVCHIESDPRTAVPASNGNHMEFFGIENKFLLSHIRN